MQATAKAQNKAITTAVTKVGARALHIVASEGGSSRDSSIYRQNLGLSNGQTYTLSYWHKRGQNSYGSLTIRLSGSGLTSSPGSMATRLELGTAELEDLQAWHILHAIESKKQLQEIFFTY